MDVDKKFDSNVKRFAPGNYSVFLINAVLINTYAWLSSSV